MGEETGGKPVRHDGWTDARKARFLEVLAETCNVTAAVAATGLVRHSAYLLRARDAAFAQAWQDALALGYDRLEADLLRHAINGLADSDMAAATRDAAGAMAAGDTAVAGGTAAAGDTGAQGDRSAGGDSGAKGDRDARGGADARAAVRTRSRPGSGLSPGMSMPAAVELGLTLLNRHRATIDGRNRPMPRGTATQAETDAALLRQIAKLTPRTEPEA